MRFILGMMLFTNPLFVNAQTADKRLSQPEAAAIEKARKDILEIFGKDIEKSKTPAARKELAERLLRAAKDGAESPANRWVLFNQARDLAIAANDALLAMQTVNEFATVFGVNRGEIAADTIEKLGKVTATVATKGFVDLVVVEADQAIDADEYKAAVKLATVGLRGAQSIKDAGLIRKLDVQLKLANELSKAFDDVKGIDEQMGKFQCFRKGNWAKGLPLLVNAQEENLAAVAKKDLTNPNEAKGQCDVGDAWFELAQKRKGDEHVSMLRRAYYWYRLGVGGATGLAKARTEQRLAKMFVEIDEADAKKGLFTLYEGHWAIHYKAPHPSWDYTITKDGEITISNSKDRNGRKGNVVRKGGALLFLTDNATVIERIRYQGNSLQLERFSGGDYPNPNRVQATATLEFKP